MIESGEPKYDVFISYSHQDKPTARWLYRKLDGYRPPADGRDSPNSAVPAKAARWRAFIDEDELGAAANLSVAIDQALRSSKALVVVCSPDCAKSRYVNEEVRFYKSVHGGTSIFAVIASGQPGAAQNEAFPPALKFAVAGDGSLTSRPEEPIGADLTKFDQKTVLLKLIAGLLGLTYSDLANREQARRLRRIL
jgi:hypothetical protein